MLLSSVAFLSTPELDVRARCSFVTRRVPATLMAGISTDEVPRSGDLVVAEITRLRQHTKLELVDGRRSQLFAGDHVVLAYGNRYAPDQFEAEIPLDLGPAHMVAAGGIAARVVSRHRSVKPATEIRPLGLVTDANGRVLNVADFALPAGSVERELPPVIAVCGTSMNAGKSTMAASLVRGLTLAGRRVGYAKLTGTGSGPDVWLQLDAGAVSAIDFTDAGWATTAGADPARLVEGAWRLVEHLAACDVVVVEVADGILQRETAGLLADPGFARLVDGYLFAASDQLSAIAGASHLRASGAPLLAVGGAFTQSRLAVEEAELAVGADIHGSEALSDPVVATELVAAAMLDRLTAAV